jgi:hypothetical protein
LAVLTDRRHLSRRDQACIAVEGSCRNSAFGRFSHNSIAFAREAAEVISRLLLVGTPRCGVRKARPPLHSPVSRLLDRDRRFLEPDNPFLGHVSALLDRVNRPRACNLLDRYGQLYQMLLFWPIGFLLDFTRHSGKELLGYGSRHLLPGLSGWERSNSNAAADQGSMRPFRNSSFQSRYRMEYPCR